MRPYKDDGSWGSVSWNESDSDEWQFQIEKARDDYYRLYSAFMIELEKVLKKEEEAQGDIVA